MTKNDDARKVYLTPELKVALREQQGRVDEVQRHLAKGNDVARIIPYLFPHLTGKRAGTPRTAFYKAWRTACRKAGVPGMLTHDFRRTAVRKTERTGVRGQWRRSSPATGPRRCIGVTRASATLIFGRPPSDLAPPGRQASKRSHERRSYDRRGGSRILALGVTDQPARG
jgi:hypothetical protein